MRWIKEPPPNRNAVRRVEKFLWFPKTINFETRWLETTAWEEQYDRNFNDPLGNLDWIPFRWVNLIGHQSVDRIIEETKQ